MTRAILLVDHGSRRSEANRALEETAERVRARAPEYIVRFAHMELAEPDLARAIEDCAEAGALEIVVHPFFLAAGRHSSHDIPRLVAQAALNHPELMIRVTAPLGPDEKLVDLILERVAQCK
ncbi:MAG: CbiX/SirB N-terminal domain-containing protein [Myxococcota bacterium]